MVADRESSIKQQIQDRINEQFKKSKEKIIEEQNDLKIMIERQAAKRLQENGFVEENE